MPNLEAFDMIAKVRYIPDNWPRSYRVNLYHTFVNEEDKISTSSGPIVIDINGVTKRTAFTKNGAIKVAKRGAKFWATERVNSSKDRKKTENKSFVVNLSIQIEGDKVKVT